jgi:predicted esterase
MRTMAESWVKVAAAPDETDALLMEGVLKDAGIPSLIQRAPGFDAPDFLSAGPRDVLVPGALVEEAKQVLEDTTGLGSYAP